MVDLNSLPNKNYAGLSLICVVGRCKQFALVKFLTL